MAPPSEFPFDKSLFSLGSFSGEKQYLTKERGWFSPKVATRAMLRAAAPFFVSSVLGTSNPSSQGCHLALATEAVLKWNTPHASGTSAGFDL